jgi:hypothetical protein
MALADISRLAQSQYYARPADERFATVDDLIAHAQHEKDLSKERNYNWRDLRWTYTSDTNQGGKDGLYLQSPNGTATLTHWSFGQAATMLQSPARYLREGLTPELAAQCLNHRITQQPSGTAPVLLVRKPNGAPHATIRAVTSETYTRVWDATLYDEYRRRFAGTLATPPSWDDKPAGVYRSDRDSFVLGVNGGSIVRDMSVTKGNDEMYRGVMIRNSEVGACAIWLISFLFRAVCGNHLLMGVDDVRQFCRRHVGKNALRETMQELNTLAYKWVNRSAAQDESMIKSLLSLELAHTKDAVIDELRKVGYTQQDATAAYERCEGTESASPRSYWGIVQGTTRVSQDTPYQDDRLELDQLAAKVLARGRKLVAA